MITDGIRRSDEDSQIRAIWQEICDPEERYCGVDLVEPSVPLDHGAPVPLERIDVPIGFLMLCLIVIIHVMAFLMALDTGVTEVAVLCVRGDFIARVGGDNVFRSNIEHVLFIEPAPVRDYGIFGLMTDGGKAKAQDKCKVVVDWKLKIMGGTHRIEVLKSRYEFTHVLGTFFSTFTADRSNEPVPTFCSIIRHLIGIMFDAIKLMVETCEMLLAMRTDIPKYRLVSTLDEHLQAAKISLGIMAMLSFTTLILMARLLRSNTETNAACVIRYLRRVVDFTGNLQCRKGCLLSFILDWVAKIPHLFSDDRLGESDDPVET